jgi:hypothetical protein
LGHDVAAIFGDRPELDMNAIDRQKFTQHPGHALKHVARSALGDRRLGDASKGLLIAGLQR